MEKDLKDKKQEEKNTPKIPWTKLVPAAAVIAALVFSGIKAKGSDGETEAVGQAETTVMSASELEKYLGYEKENTVSDSTTATAEKNSTTKKKSSSKKSAKKTAAKKSSGIRTVSESAKSNAGAAGQGTTQTPVASVPADGYKDGTYEGSGTGFGGTIRVRVTISGGKIAAIDILEASGETASYFASAQGVISRMIAGNTPNVDAVSGATYSSNGIIQQFRMPSPRQRQMETASRSPLHLQQLLYQLRHQLRHLQKNHLLQRNRKIRTVPKNIWTVNIQLRQRASMET